MPKNRVLIVGSGSFAQSSAEAFASEAEFVGVYLSKPCGDLGLRFWSKCNVFNPIDCPDIERVILANKINLVLPSSLDWIREVWPRVLESLGKERCRRTAK